MTQAIACRILAGIVAFVPDSNENIRAFLEAEDIASRSGQPLSSAHLLLALFTFPNRALVLLQERGLSEDRVLKEIRVIEDEPKRTLISLRDRARELAASAASNEVDCLHLLISLSRHRDAFAYRLLERCGLSLTALRNIAVSYVTGNMPRRYRTVNRSEITEDTSSRMRGSRPGSVRTQENVLEPQPRTSAPAIMLAPEPDDYEQEEAPELPAPAPAKAAAPAPQAKVAAAPAGRELKDLAPTLATCGYDLTERARAGQLDMAIGRERELEAVIDTLGKRRSNNPVLVGPAGVGKTAVVEGLAVKIARGDEDTAHFKDCIVFALDTGALVAGTSLRGAFSERLGAIKNEVAAAQGRIIVFIDELHTLIGAGASGEGAQDAANELKTALARGEFPCIGATTIDEYKKYIEKDPALERRFAPVFVEEPSVDEAILILEGSMTPYAEHHNVVYSLEAIHAAVQLSHRFIAERKLPDKAFAVMDLAGSRARRRVSPSVERLDVARVIHEWSGVPLDRLADADTDRFAQAEELIREKLVGHSDVVSAVCRALRRGFAGFNGRRPMGSFLFLGPTGVGKTELVKILAEFLFGRRDALVRIDMSELSEAHATARLVGAQPGYVGYEEGGQLTEALRKRPFQVVLFDEIEKAHRDVLHLLLQVLDEGHLTDSRGRRVSFANTLIVLTSNLGADKLGSGSGTLGFGSTSTAAPLDRVLEAARSQLSPELWGRLDDRLVFQPLSREQVREVAVLQLRESAASVFAEREVTLEWSPAVVDFLMNHGGYTPAMGARGMRQAISRHVEGPVAEQLLSHEIERGDVVELTVGGDTIVARRMSDLRRRQSSVG